MHRQTDMVIWVTKLDMVIWVTRLADMVIRVTRLADMVIWVTKLARTHVPLLLGEVLSNMMLSLCTSLWLTLCYLSRAAGLRTSIFNQCLAIKLLLLSGCSLCG